MYLSVFIQAWQTAVPEPRTATSAGESVDLTQLRAVLQALDLAPQPPLSPVSMLADVSWNMPGLSMTVITVFVFGYIWCGFMFW